MFFLHIHLPFSFSLLIRKMSSNRELQMSFFWMSYNNYWTFQVSTIQWESLQLHLLGMLLNKLFSYYSKIFFKVDTWGVPVTLTNRFKIISKLKRKHLAIVKEAKYDWRITNCWHVAQWVSRHISNATPPSANLANLKKSDYRVDLNTWVKAMQIIAQ